MYYVLARYSAISPTSPPASRPVFFNEHQLEIDWHIFCTISSLRYTTRSKYYLSGGKKKKLLPYTPFAIRLPCLCSAICSPAVSGCWEPLKSSAFSSAAIIQNGRVRLGPKTKKSMLLFGGKKKSRGRNEMLRESKQWDCGKSAKEKQTKNEQ